MKVQAPGGRVSGSSTARPNVAGKAALLPRNNRPYGLERNAVQAKKALARAGHPGHTFASQRGGQGRSPGVFSLCRTAMLQRGAGPGRLSALRAGRPGLRLRFDGIRSGGQLPGSGRGVCLAACPRAARALFWHMAAGALYTTVHKKGMVILFLLPSPPESEAADSLRCTRAASLFRPAGPRRRKPAPRSEAAFLSCLPRCGAGRLQEGRARSLRAVYRRSRPLGVPSTGGCARRRIRAPADSRNLCGNSGRAALSV